MDLQQRIKEIADSARFACPVCGEALYITDYSDRTLTFHCSSDKAKFWNFGRGTGAVSDAKAHWDESARELTLLGDPT